MPTLPWGEDGLAQRATDWIRDGAVTNLRCGRFWARKTGRAPLPRAPNFALAGTERAIEDLVRATERGVLVTDLWYIREVDPRTLTYTGLTRDGVFWTRRALVPALLVSEFALTSVSDAV
jgi:predicted Zn-dependent protease